MSGHTCRETYCSYGSYLRSRGYDKSICNLFNDIENGKVKIGSIEPNGTCGVDITGSVNIQPCAEQVLCNGATAGCLNIYGGNKGTSTNATDKHTLGLQAMTGAHITGPIIQTGLGAGGNAGGNVTEGPYTGDINVFANKSHFINYPIEGDITGTAKKVEVISAAPTSTTQGESGEIKANQGHIYICFGADATVPGSYIWKKSPLVSV
jgi:hypothetical protein